MTDTPAQPPTQTPKKPKLPLDFVLLKMNEAMETLFAYDHDPNFVPSADQLLLIEMLHKQIAGYAAMSIIIVQTMRQRVNEALSATAPGVTRRCSRAPPQAARRRHLADGCADHVRA